MTDSYKFSIRSQISRAKFRQILKLFALDLTAVQISKLSNLNRNTINRYLTIIRTLVAFDCELQSPFSGEVELDESYFGSRHQKGKRGRGAENKHIVFGIYKRNGYVYTEIVENVKAKTLQQVIKQKVRLDSTIYTDGFRANGGTQLFISAIRNTFVFIIVNLMPKVMFTSMESKAFGGYAKVRLVKFRGLSKNTFYLHLKECEFRFNNRKQDLYKVLLKLTKQIQFR